MTREADARAIIEWVAKSTTCVFSNRCAEGNPVHCMPCRARAWLAAHPEPGETVPCKHPHGFRQHRDCNPPWCPVCGLGKDGRWYGEPLPRPATVEGVSDAE